MGSHGQQKGGSRTPSPFSQSQAGLALWEIRLEGPVSPPRISLPHT